MSALLLPVIAIVVLATITPIPAIACFYAAWRADRRPAGFSQAAVFPTTVFPAILLVLHGLESNPEWKVYGFNYKSYLAMGWSAWVYLPPFAASNFLIARSVIDPDYVKASPLTHLSLLTCLLTSLFFAVGNYGRQFYWLFPTSTACAYGYGLFLFLKLQGIPRMLIRWWLVLVAWLITSVLTVFAAIVQTQQMVDQLPDEPLDCFIVTAASKGHPKIVGSYVDAETNQRTSRQLNSFRTFEEWLKGNAPKLHELARQKYNIVGPVIARRISNRWLASIVYLALKPMEWLLRLVASATDCKPSQS